MHVSANLRAARKTDLTESNLTVSYFQKVQKITISRTRVMGWLPARTKKKRYNQIRLKRIVVTCLRFLSTRGQLKILIESAPIWTKLDHFPWLHLNGKIKVEICCNLS